MAAATAHVPAITVLTTAAAIEWLEAEEMLAETLMRIQTELSSKEITAVVQIDPGLGTSRPWKRKGAPAATVAMALRTRVLARQILVGAPLPPGETLDVQTGHRHPPKPLPESLWTSAVACVGAGMRPAVPLFPEGSHELFFEHRHLDKLETTLPWSDEEAPGLQVRRWQRDRS